MPTPIDFHFDYLSPYAYLAWKELPNIAAQYGRIIQPRPTLLAALLKAGETKGPAEIPRKRVYIGKNVLRTARTLNIPLGLPPTHPFNPLLALRVTLMPMSDADRLRIVDAFFHEVWSGEGKGVEAPENVARVLHQLGFDGAKLVSDAKSEEAKARLRNATEDALARGVFGVPTMFVDGELFWGHDSFPHLILRLEGKDPLDSLPPELLQNWMRLEASASRK